MGAPKPPQQIEVKVTWQGVEQHPVMAANSFLLQATGQEFILSAGFALLPYFENPEREGPATKSIPAHVIARFSMTPGRVVELLGMLQQALTDWQKQQKH